MRKLAWLMLILLIIAVVIITLAATNYAGIGNTLYDGAEGTMFMPIRSFCIDNWIAVGNSGFAWIFLSSFLQGLVWTFFLVGILYSLLWQKAIQQKLLNKTTRNTSPSFQSAPAATIPVTGLQSQPITPITPTPTQEEKKAEEA